ncbi:hypothetical protein J6TS2_14090 [Heyndrickxia sporothermodurans]|nr:hypothetical protein J6TS2_14090 [Heyndrickxia sporothermodurans]
MKLLDYKEEIRRFNRFYTRIIGINNQYTDETTYSATEAQLLYEISVKERCKAVYLSEYFKLDKGYLSRILKRFENNGLIRKAPSVDDKRSYILQITDKGKNELKYLISSSNEIVEKMIRNISIDKREELIQAMKKIELIFSQYKDDLNDV